MMNYTGWEIPEGKVVKVEDASGRVIWALQSDKPVVLQVEKITSDTYAAETTYKSEQFILLDIYPKTNGAVKVTYGGLTKTIVDTSGAEEPNAQQVYFGTFNGVSDEVGTPASGELTIEGQYRGVCVGYYDSSSKLGSYCACVKEVKKMNVNVKAKAFVNNTNLTKVYLQNGVKRIGQGAFSGCSGLEYVFIPKTVEDIYFVKSGFQHSFYDTARIENPIVIDSENAYYHIDGNCLIRNSDKALLSGFINSVIPNGITTIWDYAFYYSTGLKSITIPDSVASIGVYAFGYCSSLTSVTIPASVTEIGGSAFFACSGLSEIVFLATTPPNLGNADAVGGTSFTFPIIVPKGCGEVYKAATNWSTCADRIVEAS